MRSETFFGLSCSFELDGLVLANNLCKTKQLDMKRSDMLKIYYYHSSLISIIIGHITACHPLQLHHRIADDRLAIWCIFRKQQNKSTLRKYDSDSHPSEVHGISEISEFGFPPCSGLLDFCALQHGVRDSEREVRSPVQRDAGNTSKKWISSFSGHSCKWKLFRSCNQHWREEDVPHRDEKCSGDTRFESIHLSMTSVQVRRERSTRSFQSLRSGRNYCYLHPMFDSLVFCNQQPGRDHCVWNNNCVETMSATRDRRNLILFVSLHWLSWRNPSVEQAIRVGPRKSPHLLERSSILWHSLSCPRKSSEYVEGAVLGARWWLELSSGDTFKKIFLFSWLGASRRLSFDDKDD